MASLVDVFVQNKTTTLDVPTSTSKDEGVKEAPSLFDSLLSDTAKYLPDLKVLDHTDRLSFYSRIIKENMQRGMNEKLYRENLNIDLITLFFTSAMAKIYSWDGAYIYLKDPYVFHSELIRYHLESVVNDEGRKILKSFF